jgi:hypothetical protein
VCWKWWRRLKFCVHDPLLLFIFAICSQVIWHWMVFVDHRGILIDDMQLVLVGQTIIPGPEFANGFIVLVQEGRVFVTVPICYIMASFKAKWNILSLKSSSLKIGSPNRKVREAGQDQIASVCEDVCSCSERSMARSLRTSREWCNEPSGHFPV